jgi:hypothetical protein
VSKHPSVLFTEPTEFVAEIVRDQQRGLVEAGSSASRRWVAR